MIRVLMVWLLIARVAFCVIISPPIVHEEFRDGIISKEIRIRNNSFDRIRFIVDIEGDRDYSRWSLEDSIKVFPRVISLGAKESKSIRVRVVKDDLESGEYKCYVVLREREVKASKEDKIHKKVVSNLRFLHNYWISIYGRYGEIDESVEIEHRYEGNIVATKVRSTGNTGRGIGLRVVDDTKKIVYKKPICRVMREKSVDIKTKLDIETDSKMSIEYYDLSSEEVIKEVRFSYEKGGNSSLPIN